jgi:hypothetical protein
MDNSGFNCVEIEAQDSSVDTSNSMFDDIGTYIIRLTQINMKMVVSSYYYYYYYYYYRYYYYNK